MRPVRIRAHPVVQIEEHRGALRRGLEQIAELAEDVRPDRFALVLGEHEAIGPLLRVDIEMIEPEIGQHFLQLPLAVDRAQQLLLAQLDDDAVGFLLHRLFFGGRRAVVRFLFLARLDCRPFEFVGELARAHANRPQARETATHAAVGNAIGPQLFVDIALDAGGHDAFDVPRPWPEADAVEHVLDRARIGRRRPRGADDAGGEDDSTADEQRRCRTPRQDSHDANLDLLRDADVKTAPANSRKMPKNAHPRTR